MTNTPLVKILKGRYQSVNGAEFPTVSIIKKSLTGIWPLIIVTVGVLVISLTLFIILTVGVLLKSLTGIWTFTMLTVGTLLKSLTGIWSFIILTV
jgi:hypothetical protein